MKDASYASHQCESLAVEANRGISPYLQTPEEKAKLQSSCCIFSVYNTERDGRPEGAAVSEFWELNQLYTP